MLGVQTTADGSLWIAAGGLARIKEVNLDYPAIRVVSIDPGISLIQLAPVLQFQVNTAGAAGRSFLATFESHVRDFAAATTQTIQVTDKSSASSHITRFFRLQVQLQP